MPVAQPEGGELKTAVRRLHASDTLNDAPAKTTQNRDDRFPATLRSPQLENR